MGVIDIFLTNSDNIGKGFKELTGKKDYIIAYYYDTLVCYFYDLDAGKALINKYLEEQEYDLSKIRYEKKTLKKKSEEVLNMKEFKIVILDKKIKLYKDIVELAKTTNIKGYKEGKLKETINVYQTID
jgi:hypothetical protein